MRYGSDGKLKNDGICSLKVRLACAFHSITARLPRFGVKRSAAVLVICALCIFGMTRMSLALAVSVEGDFVGYAANRQELEAILDKVRVTAAGALGDDYELDTDIKYHVSFGKAEDDIAGVLEDKIYSDISEIASLEIVYVDGNPVCAFSTAKDAADAMDELINSYVNENTQSASFAEQIVVSTGYTGVNMLENNIKTLHEAVTVLTTELTVTEQTVKHSTSYILDESMYENEYEIVTPGQLGRNETDYLITRSNGKLVSYEKLESRVITEPVTASVRVGTIPSYSTGSYIWPCGGEISSYFGSRNITVGSSYHCGIDIAADYADPVWAADGGIVSYASEYGNYGLLVKIEHDNGDITYYAHCSKLLVKVGDIIKQGQMIAEMGSTGLSTGVHLHFEIRPEGGAAVDPLTYLPEGVIEANIIPG